MIFKKRALILLFIALMILPVSMAFEITNAELKWNNKTVTYYSDNTPITVNLELTLSTSNLENILVDMKDINNRYQYNHLTSNYASRSINEAHCSEIQEGQHKCVFTNLILRKSSPELNISANKNELSSSKKITLQKTNSNPKIIFLGTKGCHDNKCYVASGFNEVTLQLENSQAGFARSLIGFRAGARDGSVINCESNNCSGVINMHCQDGQELTANLAPYMGAQSRDDAGRTITNQAFTWICDSNPPTIQNMEIVDARAIGVTEITDTFRIVANISDQTSPIMSMSVLGDSINSNNATGSCIKTGSTFNCMASIKAQVSKSGTYEVPVIFKDAAGNEVKSSVNVDLVEVESSMTPDFWRIGKTTQTTNSINVRNLAYERTIYTEVTLTGDADLLTVKTQATTCIPKKDNVTGVRGDITKLDIINFDKETNKVYLRIGLRPTGLNNPSNNRYLNYEKIEHECSIDVQTKRGGYFYSQPQKLNFTISIELDKSQVLTERMFREIEHTKEDVERKQKSLDNWGMMVDRTMQMCSMIVGVDTIGGVISAAGGVVSGAGAIIGQPQIGAPIVKTGDATNTMIKGPQMEGIVKGCNFFSCKEGMIDQTLGVGLSSLDKLKGSESISGLLGRGGYSEFFDPYKSEYVAYATQCVPAIIHHQRVKQSIECNYLDCISNGMFNQGQSLTYCKSERSYSNCVYQTRGVLDALPVVNMYRDFSTRFGEVLSDPISLFGFATPLMCNLIPEEPTGAWTIPKSVCLTTVFVQSVGELSGMLNGITKQIQQIGQVNPLPQCSVALSHADLIATENLRQDRTVGYYPDPLSFEYLQSIGPNVSLSYDSSQKSFVIVQGNASSPDKLKTLAYLSPTETGATVQNLQKYALIGPEGQYLGTPQQLIENNKNNLKQIEGLNKNIVDHTNFIQYKENELQNLRNELAIIIPPENWNQITPIGVSPLLGLNEKSIELMKNIQGIEFDIKTLKEKIQMEQNSIDSINTNLPLALTAISNDKLLEEEYKKAHKAYYVELEKRYGPEMAEYYAEMINLDKAYYDTVRDNQQKIDELNEAISGISVFKSNQDITASLVELEKDKTSACAKPESRACKNAKQSVEAYTKAKSECSKLPSGKSCTRSELKELQKDLSKNIKDAKKELNKAKRVASINEKWIDSFGSFDVAVKTAWGTANGISTIKQISTSMGGEWGIEFSRYTALGQTSQWFKDVGVGDWGICNSQVSQMKQESGGVAIKAGAAGHRAGAYIVGRKSTMQTVPGEKNYYDYWIEGGITTSKGTDLGYNVVLYGPQGKEQDISKIITGDDSPFASKGRPELFGGLNRMRNLKLEDNYDTVCIVFTTSGLSDYFDVVSIQGNKVCQKIVSEN